MLNPKYDKMLDYVVFYPSSLSEDYDGIHDGGVKGLRPNAPEKIKELYKEWRKLKKNDEETI